MVVLSLWLRYLFSPQNSVAGIQLVKGGKCSANFAGEFVLYLLGILLFMEGCPPAPSLKTAVMGDPIWIPAGLNSPPPCSRHPVPI